MSTGRTCETFIDVLGVGNGTWLEVKALGDVDQPDSFNEEAQNTRETPFETVELGSQVVSLGFELVVTLTDPVYLALRAAYNARTVIGVANFIGPMADAGSEGMQWDGHITEFPKSIPLQGKVKIAIRVKPAYRADTPPVWVVVA